LLALPIVWNEALALDLIQIDISGCDQLYENVRKRLAAQKSTLCFVIKNVQRVGKHCDIFKIAFFPKKKDK